MLKLLGFERVHTTLNQQSGRDFPILAYFAGILRRSDPGEEVRAAGSAGRNVSILHASEPQQVVEDFCSSENCSPQIDESFIGIGAGKRLVVGTQHDVLPDVRSHHRIVRHVRLVGWEVLI